MTMHVLNMAALGWRMGSGYATPPLSYSAAGLSDGAFSALANDGTLGGDYDLGVGAGAPQVSSGAIVTDGDDAVRAADPTTTTATLGSPTATTLPDTARADAGKGFTCTGLTYIPTGTYAGKIAVTDWGKAALPAGGNAPHIVICEPTAPHTILAEIEIKLRDGTTTPGGAQGVACDALGQLWVALNLDGEVVCYDQAGAQVGGTDVSAAMSAPNGVCIIPVSGGYQMLAMAANATGRLFDMDLEAGTLTDAGAIDISGGVSNTSAADHLAYHQGRVYTTSGIDNAGRIGWIDVDTRGASVIPAGRERATWLSPPDADAIEGIAILPDGTLLIASDEYTHTTGVQLNRMLAYSGITYPAPALGPKLAVAAVTDLAAPHATEARIIAAGQGDDASFDYEVALWYVNATGYLRLWCVAPQDAWNSRRLTVDFEVDMEGAHSWVVEGDLDTGVFRLSVDGGGWVYAVSSGEVNPRDWSEIFATPSGWTIGAGHTGLGWERYLPSGSVSALALGPDGRAAASAAGVSYPGAAENYSATYALSVTAPAEAAHTPEAITGLLSDGGLTGTALVWVGGDFPASFPVAETITGAAHYDIASDGTGTIDLASEYQYLPFGLAANLTLDAISDAGELVRLSTTVAGSYTATLYLMPEDGESFTGISGQTDDLTGALPEGTQVKLATIPAPAYGVTSGTVSRIGGDAGDAHLQFGADGYVTYTPTLENLLDDVSFAFVIDENATGVILVTETPTATLEIEVVGFGVVQMTLTQGESEWTVATVCGYVDGKIGFAGRISSDELALIDYGDAAGAEQVEDITGYVPDAYTQTRLGGVAGLEVYGAPLRRGPGIDADQQVTYLNALGAARMDPVRATYTAADDAFYYDPAAPGGAYQTSGGAAADAATDPVGYLTDLTGNGYHATQTTAADRPLLQDIGNGSLAMDFDGSSDHLDIPAGAVDPVSVTIIAFEGPATGAQTYLLAAAGSGSENRFYVREEAAGGIVVQVGPQNASTPISVTEGDIYVGIIVSDGATVELFLNGTSQSASCAGATSAYTGRAIGAFPFSAGSWPKMIGPILHMHGEIGVNWTLAEINAAAAAIGAQVGADSIAVAT